MRKWGVEGQSRCDAGRDHSDRNLMGNVDAFSLCSQFPVNRDWSGHPGCQVCKGMLF